MKLSLELIVNEGEDPEKVLNSWLKVNVNRVKDVQTFPEKEKPKKSKFKFF